MSESIWISLHPDSDTSRDLSRDDHLQKHLQYLWDRSENGKRGRPNQSAGGHGRSEDDDTSVFEMPALAYDRLQKFCNGVLGLVKFKTCEIFLASLSKFDALDPDARFKTEIYFRAGAYRPLAKKYGGRSDKPTSETRGARPLSKLKSTVHSPLYYFIRGGEPDNHYAVRKKQFLSDDRSNERSKQMNAYIDYRIVGTIVAMLAKCGPDRQDVRAALFWEYASKIVNSALQTRQLDKIDGLPDARTRDALSLLVKGHKGGLILEDSEIADSSSFDSAVANAKKLLDGIDHNEEAKESIESQFSIAWRIWETISSNSKKICSAVRAGMNEHQPGDVLRFLCEARPRSYIPWLRSATLSLDPHGPPILLPNLDRMIEECSDRKNKLVDVNTKNAYERAANALLSARTGRGAKSASTKVSLTSMLLIPFSAQIGTGRQKLGTQGFMRLMNRMSGDGSTYDYGNRNGLVEGEEEDRLAKTIQKILCDGLSDGSLFHLPAET